MYRLIKIHLDMIHTTCKYISISFIYELFTMLDNCKRIGTDQKTHMFHNFPNASHIKKLLANTVTMPSHQTQYESSFYVLTYSRNACFII